ncbi:MAG: phage holin family protein [Leptolyngbyaceae cyanobacterium]
MLILLITLVVNALTLLILSLIPPLGIEVKPLGALLGGAIIGLFNGIWSLFPQALRTFTAVLSLGVIPLIGAIIVFGLAAALVEGFRLRFGFWSLILGAISFAIVNSILFWLLRQTGLLPV